MGYQTSPATITVTRDGRVVDVRPDYETKTVSVFVDGQHLGTFKCHTAAREALDLIEVAKPKRK